jgi:1-acyl-sn-glycerol-3-phosphate acyltransferase
LHLAFFEKVNEFLCRFWYRWRRIGPCPVPRSGPVIIVANHTCPADPLMLCAGCTYRKISFLIAREYANFPVWRFFVRMIECIPVRRDGKDVAATRQALRRLRDGHALGIFIEGRITPPGHTPQLRDGAALLALRSGATVIPAHISGTIYHDGILASFLARHRVRIRFGAPVDLTDLAEKRDRGATAAATARIYARILALGSE